MNALAAAAVGTVLQVPAADIVAGLQAHRGMYGRLAVRRGRGAVTLIDDTYNANPNSVQAALQFLGHLPTAGRRLVVLGDMLELGTAAPTLHRQAGAQAAAIQVAHLIALGTFAQEVAHGACAAGMAPSHIHVVTSRQEALALLERLQEPGDVILLKGSRGMAMEHLVQALAVDEGGH
jgi:UDP-N-acetylmuramoyl-tripeptide--D-alanyl-D-alanine ligase